MYISALFTILLIAILLAWFGQRERSMLVFTITMIFAISVFIHHMTGVIGLSL